ncbi:MAG: hypothetical protein QXL47_03305 [Candidatus Anstonellales archaeon]
MPKSEFLSFFQTFPPNLREFFLRKPEPDSPYANITNQLVDMIAKYCGKRFARKIVANIPNGIIEQLNDEKMRKLKEKVMAEIQKESRKIEKQLIGVITEYGPSEGLLDYCSHVYYATAHKEAIRNAVKKVFSEENLKEILNS